MRGLSPVAASGGHPSLWFVGLSPLRLLLQRSTSSRRAGSVVVAHGASCSAACRIFPDQGPNPCPLHWQVDSEPLRHQGSPGLGFLSGSSCIRARCGTAEASGLRGSETQKGASLVAQWLRICLPIQGTRVRALVWEDPTCRGATSPVSHNY